MLYEEDIKKIENQIKDFRIKPHFQIADLQYYDKDILKKIENKNLYEKVADITLHFYQDKNHYGGYAVRIYKSKKNSHYIYWEYYYGD